MRDVGPKSKVGRPYTFDALPLDEIIPLLLNHGMRGGFWETFPAEIYKKTGHIMCLFTLQKITDEEFLAAKRLAASFSFEYWTEQMAIATIPPVAWIWISKNVAKWRDDRHISLELPDSNKQLSEKDKEERLLQLRLRLQEVAK